MAVRCGGTEFIIMVKSSSFQYWSKCENIELIVCVCGVGVCVCVEWGVGRWICASELLLITLENTFLN